MGPSVMCLSTWKVLSQRPAKGSCSSLLAGGKAKVLGLRRGGRLRSYPWL
jgi:hypothetical protein